MVTGPRARRRSRAGGGSPDGRRSATGRRAPAAARRRGRPHRTARATIVAPPRASPTADPAGSPDHEPAAEPAPRTTDPAKENPPPDASPNPDPGRRRRAAHRGWCGRSRRGPRRLGRRDHQRRVDHDDDSAPDDRGGHHDRPCRSPVTAAAISQAIQNAGDQPTSVDAPQCGNGWAGADYSTHGEDVAALFKAQGGQWVDVDRSQNCNDPSIPANVHVFCTVS